MSTLFCTAALGHRPLKCLIYYPKPIFPHKTCQWVLLFSLCKWKGWGSERLGSLPKSTALISGRDGIWTRDWLALIPTLIVLGTQLYNYIWSYNVLGKARSLEQHRTVFSFLFFFFWVQKEKTYESTQPLAWYRVGSLFICLLIYFKIMILRLGTYAADWDRHTDIFYRASNGDNYYVFKISSTHMVP